MNKVNPSSSTSDLNISESTLTEDTQKNKPLLHHDVNTIKEKSENSFKDDQVDE